MIEVEKPQINERTARDQITEMTSDYERRYNNLMYSIVNYGESIHLRHLREMKKLIQDQSKLSEYEDKIKFQESLSEEIKNAMDEVEISSEMIKRYRRLKNINAEAEREIKLTSVEVEFFRDFFTKVALIYSKLREKYSHEELWS